MTHYLYHVQPFKIVSIQRNGCSKSRALIQFVSDCMSCSSVTVVILTCIKYRNYNFFAEAVTCLAAKNVRKLSGGRNLYKIRSKIRSENKSSGLSWLALFVPAHLTFRVKQEDPLTPMTLFSKLR